MKRLIPLLILLWAAQVEATIYAGGCAIVAMRPPVSAPLPAEGYFYAKFFDGTQAGFDAAKSFVGSKGLIQIHPGCEGVLSFGTLPDSVMVIESVGGTWRITGKVVAFNLRGTQRFLADSLGIAVTGYATVSDSLLVSKTAKILSHLNLGNFGSAANLRMTNNGALYFMDTSGGLQRFMGAAGSTLMRIWPIVSAGSVDVRRFDESDFIMRFTDPRLARAKDFRADSISTQLSFGLPLYTFAGLPSFGNGQLVYCVDCSPSNPATGGGTGKVARRENGVWNTGPSNPVFAEDTTGVVVRAGHEPGQTVFGRDRGYTANKGLDLRGFTDSGTQDTTANLTLDVEAPGEGDFRGLQFNIFPKGNNNGWQASSNAANNKVDVVQAGTYTWNIPSTGSGVRILMNGAANGTVPFLINGKSTTSAVLQEWQLNGSTVATIDKTGLWSGATGAFTGLVTVGDTLRVAGITDLNSTLTQFQGVDVASTGTMTLGKGNGFNITGTTNVTSITAKPSLTHATLWVTGACTITDGGNLLLNADFVGPGVLNITSDGTNWHEDTRSFP